jgi:hypothetical protein
MMRVRAAKAPLLFSRQPTMRRARGAGGFEVLSLVMLQLLEEHPHIMRKSPYAIFD